MLILRLPYAVLISVIVGITNMIPYFGPFIGAIPSTIILLFYQSAQSRDLCCHGICITAV